MGRSVVRLLHRYREYGRRTTVAFHLRQEQGGRDEDHVSVQHTSIRRRELAFPDQLTKALYITQWV